MLSICIPVYDCDVTMLVSNLLAQIAKIDIPAEIIIIDDASEIEFRKLNKPLSKSDRVSYFQLEKNIGRAKIRNLFLSYTNFDYLLFLDCDIKVSKANFLKKYVSEIEKNQPVICGGLNYQVELPPKTHYLRWKYGIKRECLPANRRGGETTPVFHDQQFCYSGQGAYPNTV